MKNNSTKTAPNGKIPAIKVLRNNTMQNMSKILEYTVYLTNGDRYQT